MAGLLYKELITHKKQLIGIGCMLLFLLLWVVVPPLSTPDLEAWEQGLVMILVMIMVFLTAGMFEQGLFEADERKILQSFIVSAPDGIKRQIGVKYLFNFLFSAALVSLFMLMFMISGAIMEMDVSMYTVLLIEFFSLQLFLRAVETPFIVRFGSKHGNYYRMILIGAASMAAIVYGLFGDLSIFGSLTDFISWMKDFLSDSSSYFLRLSPVAALLVYYISYRISCVLYLKGGEHYDK